MTQIKDGELDRNTADQSDPEPLVELAPDEAVVRALSQSAHPVEWAEAHTSDQSS